MLSQIWSQLQGPAGKVKSGQFGPAPESWVSAFALVFSLLGEPMTLAGRLCSEILQTGTPHLVQRDEEDGQKYHHNWTFLFFMHSHR